MQAGEVKMCRIMQAGEVIMCREKGWLYHCGSEGHISLIADGTCKPFRGGVWAALLVQKPIQTSCLLVV